MSMRYGKAIYSDGHEAYLVYADSPGWALTPLFPTVEKAQEWREHDFPELRRSEAQTIDLAKASEEPVHILIDIDFPEKASMWFYTTASRTHMVITGPTSRENSESLLEQGDVVYSKEFFDTWSNSAPACTKVESFASLSPARKAFIEDISRWWEDVIYMTKGDRGEHNVFDDDPDFVALAKVIHNSGVPASHKNPTSSTQEVARLAVKWWAGFYNFDGDRNVFDEEPDVVERARLLLRKAPSDDLTP
ncbi:hypothetical protein [Pseudomonas sp. CFBP 13719]|uniref:hypothetical protein n=1 Tax=Pseudomonas sp. CFBP 13719 TaxID=2775303 RepID=UPI001FD0A397|nr:hypothetical protein [Pseudomonas sp. CFBP 13719]